MSLPKKVAQLMPWNWGKRPVRTARRDRAGAPDAYPGMDWFLDDDRRPARGRNFFPPAPRGRLGGDLLGTGVPRVDIEETDTALEVSAELPGMDPEDIDVSIDARSVTIRGEKSGGREEDDKQYRLRESWYGSFKRTIPLPAAVDADTAEAAYRKGTLTITLPKVTTDASAARRIEVK